MAMARDGLLPQWFSALSNTTGVPLNATIVTGLFAATLAFTMSLEQLSAMVCCRSCTPPRHSRLGIPLKHSDKAPELACNLVM